MPALYYAYYILIYVPTAVLLCINSAMELCISYNNNTHYNNVYFNGHYK